MDGEDRDRRPIAPEQAREFVEARLGRPPQDALEAAVVLEAWGGVRSARAVPLAERIMAEERGGRARRDDPASGEEIASPLGPLDYLGLTLIVAVVAAWSGPLAAQLDGDAVSTAWRVALPISLGLQWIVRRRYLAGQSRLGSLRRGGAFLAFAGAAVATVPPIALGDAGVPAAALILSWTGAMIVALRGWALPSGIALAAIAVGVGGDLPAPAALAGLGIASLVLTGLAVATAPSPAEEPAPWGRAAASGLVGAGLGLVLVSDPGIGWGVRGALPVLAFLPSFTGGLWASIHLRSIWEAVPRSARATPLGEDERRPLWNPTTAVLAGAAGRLFLAVVALSGVVAVAAAAQGASLGVALGTLVGFAVVVLASLAAGLLDSCNETWTAVVAVFVADAVVLAADVVSMGEAHAGVTLVLGGSIVLAVAGPRVLELVRRPGRRLATSLLIP
jgi:hypothetical protein